MKFLVYGEWREPVVENIKKALEIEEARRKKGETWQQTGEQVAQYIPLEGNKAVTVIDTENVKRILQWTQAYNSLLKELKIIPVVTIEEYEEAMR